MKPNEMFEDAPVSDWKPDLGGESGARFTEQVWIHHLWKKKLWGIVYAHKQSGDSGCSLRKLIEAACAEKYGPITEAFEEE
jgi:hypothetical protein